MANSLILNGEPLGIRTPDPLIKSQLLYQLSYTPVPRIRRLPGAHAPRRQRGPLREPQ